jgi:lysophospholipase L1-like esterase
VILGGINDLTQIPLPAIEKNLTSMAETAEHHGIRVVLATLLPIGEYDPVNPSSSEEIAGHQKIESLNDWLKNFAGQKHYSVVDYHSALADSHGYYQKGLSTDGVHPTDRGYERMEPILRQAIQAVVNARP